MTACCEQLPQERQAPGYCSALAGTNALANFFYFVGRIVITKCLILSTENKKFKLAFLEHEIL